MDFHCGSGILGDVMKTAPFVVGWTGAALLLAGSAKAQEPENDWEVQQINGINYVPLEKVGKFYGFGAVEREGNEISLKKANIKRRVEVEFTIGSTDCRLNRMKVVLNHQILEDEGTVFVSRGDLSGIIDPILRPNSIKEAERFTTVILDAGDGWNPAEPDESAARHTLAIARKTQDELEKQGFKVMMTRRGDEMVPLEERVKFANEIESPAVFVGITFERREDQPKGLRTTAMMPQVEKIPAEGERFPIASVALGMALHGSVFRELRSNTQDNGLSWDGEWGVPGIRHTGIVISAANLADPYEARLAANEKYQDAVAKSIAQGIMKYNFVVSRKPENDPPPGQ